MLNQLMHNSLFYWTFGIFSLIIIYEYISNRRWKRKVLNNLKDINCKFDNINRPTDYKFEKIEATPLKSFNELPIKIKNVYLSISK